LTPPPPHGQWPRGGLFWVAPIAGAILGALLYRLLLSDD